MRKLFYLLRFLIGLPLLAYACLSMIGAYDAEKPDVARASLIQSAQSISVPSDILGSSKNGENPLPINQLVHVQGQLNGTEAFDPLTQASIRAARVERRVSELKSRKSRRRSGVSYSHSQYWSSVPQDEAPVGLRSRQKLAATQIQIDSLSLPTTSVNHFYLLHADRVIYIALGTGGYRKQVINKRAYRGNIAMIYYGVKFGTPITAVGTLVTTSDSENAIEPLSYMLRGGVGNAALGLDRVVVAPGHLSVDEMAQYYTNTFARRASDFKSLYLGILFVAMMLMLTPIARVPGIRRIRVVQKYCVWPLVKRLLAQFGVALSLVVLVSLLDLYLSLV